VCWQAPKLLGGWGLKNIHFFSKALAAKIGWRLITTSSLWTRLITQKYISPRSVQDWIRNPIKDTRNCSIIWKATQKAFHVIGEGLSWKIGKGNKVRIGMDPWPGSKWETCAPSGTKRNITPARVFLPLSNCGSNPNYNLEPRMDECLTLWVRRGFG
jgi:hypothetical protein